MLSGNFNPQQLWSALGQDYATFCADKVIATQVPAALADGDYTKAWNIATNNGTSADALATWFTSQGQYWTNQTDANGNPLPPPSQPSANPAVATQAAEIVSLVQSGQYPDPRAGAQFLYDNGYYASGDLVLQLWQASLVSSPLGAVGSALIAQSSGDPVKMLDCVANLQTEAADPSVIATWSTNQWGVPSVSFAPLVTQLGSDAQAAVAAQVAANAPPTSGSVARTAGLLALGVPTTFGAAVGIASLVTGVAPKVVAVKWGGAIAHALSGAVGQVKRLAP